MAEAPAETRTSTVLPKQNPYRDEACSNLTKVRSKVFKMLSFQNK